MSSIRHFCPQEAALCLTCSPHSVPRRESNGATHYGRGGAANVFKTGSEEEAAAKKAKAEATAAVEDDESSLRKTPSPTGGRRSPEDGNGLAAKGKQWLNNLTKKA